MSKNMVEAVWECALPHSQKSVAVVLAWYSSPETGTCYASAGRIAQCTGYKIRQVHNILGQMKAAGIVEMVGRRGVQNGHGYIPIYRLIIQSPKDLQGLHNFNSEDLQNLQGLGERPESESCNLQPEVLQSTTRRPARIAPDKKNSKKNRKPLSAKSADPRFPECVEALSAAWKYANGDDIPFPFAAAEGRVLKTLLSDNPHLTIELFKRCLWNRHNSEGVKLAQAPRYWLSRILDYARGPLDRYGAPRETTHGQQARKAQDAIAATIAAVRAGSALASGADPSEPNAALSLSGGPGDECDVVEGHGRLLR